MDLLFHILITLTIDWPAFRLTTGFYAYRHSKRKDEGRSQHKNFAALQKWMLDNQMFAVQLLGVIRFSVATGRFAFWNIYFKDRSVFTEKHNVLHYEIGGWFLASVSAIHMVAFDNHSYKFINSTDV